MFAGELTMVSDADRSMLEQGIGVDLNVVADSWKERVAAILQEATLKMPDETWMQQGGKEGIHTEHLGYILAEMQFMQRAYPNMEW